MVFHLERPLQVNAVFVPLWGIWYPIRIQKHDPVFPAPAYRILDGFQYFEYFFHSLSDRELPLILIGPCIFSVPPRLDLYYCLVRGFAGEELS